MDESPRRYGALTLDTQTIQQQSFQFEQGLLALLKQFRGSSMHVVLSEFVVEEVVQHLERAMREARESLLKGIREAKRYLPNITLNESDYGASNFEPRHEARIRFDQFMKSVDGRVISVEHADMKKIMRRYFLTEPPFAQAKDKKHEFPDAISLLAIEGWARDNCVQVLAVSKDRGWLEFGHQSAFIDVLPSLSDALQLLQEDPHRAEVLVEKTIQGINRNKSGKLSLLLTHKIAEALEELDFEVVAESDMGFDIEFDGAELLEHSIESLSPGRDFTLVDVSSKAVIVEIGLQLKLKVSASISFFIYDSVDKDEMPMGSANVSHIVSIDQIRALVRLQGELIDGDVEITALEFIDVPLQVDFGHVSPDWESDTDDHFRLGHRE